MPAANVELVDRVQNEMAETLVYLHDRWEDERGLEDWADYVTEMANKANKIEGVGQFMGATERPFGFKWLGLDGYERHTRLCNVTEDNAEIETVRLRSQKEA